MFKTFILSLIVVTAFWGPACLGCSVPVFRYALERWPSDYYLAEIEYSGELTGEARDAADLLEKCSEGEGQTLCNLYVRSKQVEGLDKAKLTLRFPLYSGIGVEVWSGELDLPAVKKIVDSPVRKEITKRLVAGESGVWIFLESGNAEKDTAALKFVKEKLAELQKDLQLPEEDLAGMEGTGYDPSLVIAEENEDSIKISFSVISVSRQDAAEKFLIDLLLKTESDLFEYDDEPMVFPVFGRGRILFAIVGNGINEEIITGACVFLSGPCSCQVKELNPGVDMLVSIDWDLQLQEAFLIKEVELPELSGLTTVVNNADDRDAVIENSTISENVPAKDKNPIQVNEAETSDDGAGVIENVLIVLGSIITLIVVAGMVMKQAKNKKRKSEEVVEKQEK